MKGTVRPDFFHVLSNQTHTEKQTFCFVFFLTETPSTNKSHLNINRVSRDGMSSKQYEMNRKFTQLPILLTTNMESCAWVTLIGRNKVHYYYT